MEITRPLVNPVNTRISNNVTEIPAMSNDVKEECYITVDWVGMPIKLKTTQRKLQRSKNGNLHLMGSPKGKA